MKKIHSGRIRGLLFVGAFLPVAVSFIGTEPIVTRAAETENSEEASEGTKENIGAKQWIPSA